MKNLLVVLALLVGGAVAAHAAADTTFDGPVRSPEPAQLTTIVKSSDIVVGVNITTQTPTSVIIDTTQMYRWVEVQNLSASFLACGENSATISTGTPTSLATFNGWLIPAASTGTVNSSPPFKKFDVVPGKNFYCQSGSVTAAGRAIVYRGR